jgi:nitrogen fixation NifU-like protein
MNMDEIYREELLEHYKHPQNYGKLIKPHIKKEDSNPLCGDMQEISTHLKNEKIHDIKFTGKGCAISIAAASMLTEHLKGKTLDEVKKMTREDMLDLIGLNLTPTRVKCAMLPLMTIKKGILEYEAKKCPAKSAIKENIEENRIVNTSIKTPMRSQDKKRKVKK